MLSGTAEHRRGGLAAITVHCCLGHLSYFPNSSIQVLIHYSAKFLTSLPTE